MVVISDNGVGPPSKKLEGVAGHFGVTAMRERAEMVGGIWQIDGPQGIGTTVEYWIPDHREAP